MITSWEGMKEDFLEKYQYYYKSRDIKEEIFKFAQKEDENMEDCVERFKYILQRSRHSDLDKDILKIILLWALREDSLHLLNIVGKWDISKENFETICDYCIKCSRGAAMSGQGVRSSKTSSGGVTKAEIGNLLDNLRTDILSTLSAQMDTLKAK